MSKHTPGPWTVGAPSKRTDSQRVNGPEGFAIATTTQLHEHREDKTAAFYEAHANGRLIAAAPELLAALEHVLDRATMPGFLRDEVKAAIVKAAGGAA